MGAAGETLTASFELESGRHGFLPPSLAGRELDVAPIKVVYSVDMEIAHRCRHVVGGDSVRENGQRESLSLRA